MSRKDATYGEIFVELMQERLSEGRRFNDDGSPRSFVWDEETRRKVGAIASEILYQSEAHLSRHLGMPLEEHAKHHQGLGELIPWIRLQKHKTEKQAEFWDTLLKENVRRAIGAAFWIVAVAIIIGISGAVDWFVPIFKP